MYTLALAKAMYEVRLAEVARCDLACLRVAAIWAVRRPTSTAKEVVWTVLAVGRCTSPAWKVPYARLLWLAHLAHRLRVGQRLVQTMVEEHPSNGTCGRGA